MAASPSADAPPGQPRTLSLGAKLVLFSTLLTAAVVCASLLVLSLALKRHTRETLAESLAARQRSLSRLQRDTLNELLRNSRLLSDSPTLRAAMETFASESGRSAESRPDLLATIQTEADRIAAGLGRDLLLVTDRNGRVLAASGPACGASWVGVDLSSRPLIRRALDRDDPIGTENFGVLEVGGEHVRVGCAPIVLQGYEIGALLLGDRLDRTFAERLQQSFGCDLIVTDGRRVLTSSLASVPSRDALAELTSDSGSGLDATWVARIGGEEYVAATLSLGADGGGNDVRLYLLQSLSKSLGEANRFLFATVLACGLLAVAAAGLSALWVSRSVLRPLDDFVAFMGVVAKSGDHERRFVGREACAEVETLADAYHHLMQSLLEHERRLLQSAREDLERLERLKESEKLAALGRMLSGAAHEINNPLTGVLGNVEILMREQGLPESARPRLERIRRDGQRVSGLVKHLLKISHRDTGEATLVDLNAVLREIAEVRRHDFVGAGLKLDLEVGSAPVIVAGHELELSQVFLNLVNNAYDALKESGRPGHVRLRAEIARGKAVVEVTDDGPGMENPKRVFEHFYTTKPVGKGTGLGLSICFAVVDRHGGTITAENAPMGGARFRVELPQAHAEALAAPAAGEASPVKPSPAGLDASILVVDDEPSLVELQKEILEDLGAMVVCAASGTAAIAELERRSFDLIVSDMKMQGGVSGEDLFRWVEAHRPQGTRGFVFVTGDQAGDGSHCFIDRVGARCLMKPFSIEDYIETLKASFRESRNAV